MIKRHKYMFDCIYMCALAYVGAGFTRFCYSTPARRHLCHPGTYLYTTRINQSICLPCPDGTFMPDSLHTHTTCYSCTQIKDQNLEVLKTECNKTRDAEILCTPGYYRRRARNTHEQDRCEKCYECEHPTLPCQDYHDALCCGHINYDAVLNKDGLYECKERPILCDPGQFLNPETEECTLCPPGTFMSEVQHNKTACTPCTTVSDLGAHEIILQTCTSTEQANIGCEDGYFRNSSGNLTDDVQCLPCQKCEYQGRACEMYHDTVCCDHPDMIVVNTSSIYQCEHHPNTTSSSHPDHFLQTHNNKTKNKPAVCGENEYANISDVSLLCLPCERGTYMDKSNHKERVCKNCSQIQGSHTPRGCQVLAEDVDKSETCWVLWIVISILLAVVAVMTVSIIWLIRRRKVSASYCIEINEDGPEGISYIPDKLSSQKMQELSENTSFIDKNNMGSNLNDAYITSL